MKIFKLSIVGFLFILLDSCDLTPVNPPEPTPSPNYLLNLEWVKTYGGSNEDIGHAIIATKDKGFAILGNTKSTDGDITDKNASISDIWLLKLDSLGEKQWSKTYGGSGDDRGQSIIQNSDESYTIAGYSQSSDGDASNNEGFHDFWIFKTDKNGTILWEKSYGFSGHDHAYSIIPTSDGGYFVNGFFDVTASNGEGNDKQNKHGAGEFWAIKLDADGNKVWRRYFGGTNNDRSYQAIQTREGDFVLVGFSESTDSDITNPKGSYDIWIVKINGSGKLLWQKSVGGTGTDQAKSIVQSREGTYLIAGNTISNDGDVLNNFGNSDAWVIEVDTNGNLNQSRNYGGTEFDTAESIVNGDIANANFSEQYFVTGYTRSDNSNLATNRGENDVLLLHILRNKSLVAAYTIGGSKNDLAYDVVVNSNGEIFVTGSTESNDHDFLNKAKGDKDLFIAKWK